MSTIPSIMIVTTEFIPGEVCRPIGPILVAYCLSKSLVGDMTANVKNWTTGGELVGYSEMLEQADKLNPGEMFVDLFSTRSLLLVQMDLSRSQLTVSY